MKKLLPRIPCLASFSACFLFGFSLFFLASQNSLVAQAHFRPGLTRKIDFNLPEKALYPVREADLDEPVLTAAGMAILDRNSGVFLSTKNPDLSLLPASTVKIMTALVSLDHYSPLEVVMVPKVSDEGQDMKLIEGELITIEALLHGLLVSSANDAAQVLSKNYQEGESKFVEAMNKKGQELSLKNSFFANPTGMDNEGRKESFSSARDLAWLADYALRNERFAKIVATKEIILKDPQGKFTHPLFNLNNLLWSMPEVQGVKTGWTEKAGECLVTFVKKEGKEIIIVVLGSEDRFGETKKLINWVFADFQWRHFSVHLSEIAGM